MRAKHIRTWFRALIAVSACGWPTAPLIGMAIRGTGLGVLFDSSVGILVSGALLLILALFRRLLREQIESAGLSNTDVPPARGLAFFGVLIALHGIAGIVWFRDSMDIPRRGV